MLYKILRVFVNSLAADDMCSVLNRDNLTQQIQILLSQKQETFSQFFYALLKSTLQFEHFQKKMALIADVFSKLLARKKVLR